jgi:hypothetical protein
MRKAPPVNLDEVAKAGCGFIGEAQETGGKNYNNHLWNLTTFAEDGRAQAHRMANKNPGYSEADFPYSLIRSDGILPTLPPEPGRLDNQTCAMPWGGI